MNENEDFIKFVMHGKIFDVKSWRSFGGGGRGGRGHIYGGLQE